MFRTVYSYWKIITKIGILCSGRHDALEYGLNVPVDSIIIPSSTRNDWVRMMEYRSLSFIMETRSTECLITLTLIRTSPRSERNDVNLASVEDRNELIFEFTSRAVRVCKIYLCNGKSSQTRWMQNRPSFSAVFRLSILKVDCVCKMVGLNKLKFSQNRKISSRFLFLFLFEEVREITITVDKLNTLWTEIKWNSTDYVEQSDFQSSNLFRW